MVIMSEGRPKYQDEDWLRERYNVDGMAQWEIADICGVAQGTISNWSREFGIDTSQKDRVTVECEKCGDSYEAQPHQLDTTRFCSAECRSAYLSDEHSGEGNPLYNRIEVECDWCGSTIRKIPCRVERQDKHFCDKLCHGKWQSEHLSGENSPNWQGRVTVECSWCGDEFEKYPYLAELTEHHLCSTECESDWRSEYYAGENGPSWAGGEFPYGPGFNDQKRREVRSRDNYQCQDCGMANTEHQEVFGRALHVHHIKPARQVKDADERNSADNLITLCQSCHLSKWEPLAKSGLRPEFVSTS